MRGYGAVGSASVRGQARSFEAKPQNRIRNGEVPSTVRNAIHNDKGKAN